VRAIAERWRERGSWLRWAPDGTAPVEVFHVESGDEGLPVLLLVHGFPTCSVDWFRLTEALAGRFRVCALDFPGYGFSDKPRGWGYSLTRDTALLCHYLDEVLGAESVVVVGHDRGSSVALNLAISSAASRVAHLVLTNGNVYLPLSNLTEFQRRVLNPETAQSIMDVLTPEALAAGMGLATFSPPRTPADPDVIALATTFAHADGVRVLHETIQYLVERADNEEDWLSELARSDIPTTVVWGLEDSISPLRVATHVWSRFLMSKPGRNRLYVLPAANHYLQVDRPDALAAVLLHALDPGSPTSPGLIATGDAPGILVDCSRDALPDAHVVLRRGPG